MFLSNNFFIYINRAVHLLIILNPVRVTETRMYSMHINRGYKYIGGLNEGFKSWTAQECVLSNSW